MQVGEAIMVKTKTKEDVFGDVLYRVTEVGLDCPHCKGKDGIKFLMLGGTGPSARKGVVIVDCGKNINANIKSGITQVIAADRAKKMEEHYDKQKGSAWKGQEVNL